MGRTSAGCRKKHSQSSKGLSRRPSACLPATMRHRDTFFRLLKDVAVGDGIRLATPHGRFDYQVRETILLTIFYERHGDDRWTS